MKLVSTKENVKFFEINNGFNYKYATISNIIINDNNILRNI